MADINLTVRCDSMDEISEKAQRLNEQLKEARTLADELASMLDGLEIDIESGKRKVNAKSIMGMMSLGLDAGEKVTVSVEGADEEEAMKGIEEYLSKKSQK